MKLDDVMGQGQRRPTVFVLTSLIGLVTLSVSACTDNRPLGAPTMRPQKASWADDGTFDAGAFAPTQILGGVNLWLRGDLGVTTVDGGVSQWLDQSGAGNHVEQSDAARRFTWEGSAVNDRPGVVGSRDAVTSMIGSANLADAGDYRTLWIVVRASNTLGGALLSYRQGPDAVVAELRGGPTQAAVMGNATQDSLVPGFGSARYGGTPLILEWHWKGSMPSPSTVTFLVNGADLTVDPAPLPAEVGPDGFILGSRAGFEGTSFDGAILEVIHAPRMVSWNDSRRVRRYLAWRYAIQIDDTTRHLWQRGNSLVLGYGTPETVAAGSWRTTLAAHRPDLLQEGLSEGPTGYFHAGTKAIGTPEVIATLLGDRRYYLRDPAEYVSLMIGENEWATLMDGPLTAEQTAANIVTIGELIHSYDPDCEIFVALTPPGRSDNPHNDLYAQQRLAIAAAIDGIPHMHGVPMPVQRDDEFLDNIHRTVAGYRRLGTDGWELGLPPPR